jgi:hypothetical protein
MPGDPAKCRAHALHCEELAKTAPMPDGRRQFLNLAEAWRRLAAEFEASQGFLDVMEAIELETPKAVTLCRPLTPGVLKMNDDPTTCLHCGRSLIHINSYGDLLIGCVDCNRWGAPGNDDRSIRLAEADIIAMRKRIGPN